MEAAIELLGTHEPSGPKAPKQSALTDSIGSAVEYCDSLPVFVGQQATRVAGGRQ